MSINTETDRAYNWIKIDEDAIDVLEDKHYYLASVCGVSTPVKVKFILDAEIGFECDICHKRRFIPLCDNMVKYVTNLPELPKEEKKKNEKENTYAYININGIISWLWC